MKINVSLELELPQDGEKLAILAEMSGVKLAPAGAFVPSALPTETVAAPAKAPRAKKEKASVLVAPIPFEPPTGDPLMQAEAAAPAPAAQVLTSTVVYTEEKSALRAADLAKTLCTTFDEKEANNRPKGFRLALELLAKHKVARTTDLVHAQRLAFIADAEALLKTAPVPAGV